MASAHTRRRFRCHFPCTLTRRGHHLRARHAVGAEMPVWWWGPPSFPGPSPCPHRPSGQLLPGLLEPTLLTRTRPKHRASDPGQRPPGQGCEEGGPHAPAWGSRVCTHVTGGGGILPLAGQGGHFQMSFLFFHVY